jgi:hypothetical protein
MDAQARVLCPMDQADKVFDTELALDAPLVPRSFASKWTEIDPRLSPLARGQQFRRVGRLTRESLLDSI